MTGKLIRVGARCGEVAAPWLMQGSFEGFCTGSWKEFTLRDRFRATIWVSMVRRGTGHSYLGVAGVGWVSGLARLGA